MQTYRFEVIQALGVNEHGEARGLLLERSGVGVVLVWINVLDGRCFDLVALGIDVHVAVDGLGRHRGKVTARFALNR
jgi:hypothetical protein